MLYVVLFFSGFIVGILSICFFAYLKVRFNRKKINNMINLENRITQSDLEECANHFRIRYYNFVVYPDRSPSDWVDILKNSGFRICIFPLHDIDNDKCSVKKSHYHVLIHGDLLTSYSKVSSLTESINASKPTPMFSPKNMFLYSMHGKDGLEQYDTSDLQIFNGFDLNILK